jgi:DNA-directed RNA polymerase subunit M/transcription elongation factor TFIIS
MNPGINFPFCNIVFDTLKPNVKNISNNPYMMYEQLFRNVDYCNNCIWELSSFDNLKKEFLELTTYFVSALDVAEGVFQCRKCDCKKILMYSKQTRSGDESTSVFAQCSKCHNKWVL